MSDLLIDRLDPIIPNAKESLEAEESTRRLDQIRSMPKKALSVRIQTDSGEESVPIPASLFGAILDIVTNMAKGSAVTIVHSHAELTTKQAANVLNVSRPFVIG